MPDQANILLIMTDEHRWDYVGYLQHPTMQGLTPNLDRLAAEGAVFTRCFSVNPLCMPARNALHTGMYTFQTGQMNNVGDWPMNIPTFTQTLQRLGYHTVLTGKLHAHEAVNFEIDLTDKVWDDEVRNLGFDEVVQTSGKTMAFFTEDAYTHYLADRGLLYDYREDLVMRTEAKEGWWPSILPKEHYIDNFIGRRAVEWLEGYDGTRPFFHMISFCSPHPCYDAYQSALDQVNREHLVSPTANEHPESYADQIANYAAMIHIVDENIGRVLHTLETKGWLDNTLIIFVADHGEMLQDLGKEGKCQWEDASVRVPLVVRYPGWTKPRMVEHTSVSIHDVAATIVDFAGGEESLQQYMPGSSAISLRPFLTNETSGVRDVIYSENGGQFRRPWRMVDDGRFRYVRLLDTDEERLFDMASDPHCLHNLADPTYVSAHLTEVIHHLRDEMLQIHLRHPTPKTGKAAYSPTAPHHITRQKLQARMPR